MDWRKLNDENVRAGSAFARLLSADGALFSAREIESFAEECRLPRREAFLLLLSAALGMEEDRAFQSRYLAPAITPLEAPPWQENDYNRRIRFPEKRLNAWQLTRRRYAPYQLFPCGSMRLTEDGREIPRLGDFTVPFSYPAVLENGREWMTVTPNEIATMEKPLAEARGSVAVLGLGLGYFAFMAAQKDAVSAVTVVERSGDVIRLFQEHLLPQFPHRDKIRIVPGDAFDFLRGAMRGYDFAFVDLWHDVGDGLPLYLRCRQMETAGVPFAYWIEEDLLVFLRALMLEDAVSHQGKLDRFLPPDPADLTMDMLRAAAREIDPEEVKYTPALH